MATLKKVLYGLKVLVYVIIMAVGVLTIAIIIPLAIVNSLGPWEVDIIDDKVEISHPFWTTITITETDTSDEIPTPIESGQVDINHVYMSIRSQWRKAEFANEVEEIQSRILDWIWLEKENLTQNGELEFTMEDEMWYVVNLPSLHIVYESVGQEKATELRNLLSEFADEVRVPNLFDYDYYINDGAWFKSISAIVRLEVMQSGVVNNLNNVFGIIHFFRYEPEVLIKQSWTGTYDSAYCVVIQPYADYNGSSSDTFKSGANSFLNSFEKAGIFPIIFEVESVVMLEKRLKYFSTFPEIVNNKARFVHQTGHGNPSAINLSEDQNIEQMNVLQYTSSLSAIADSETKIIISSCSTGSFEKEDNIASLIAGASGLRVFAPISEYDGIYKIIIDNYDVVNAVTQSGKPVRVFN